MTSPFPPIERLSANDIASEAAKEAHGIAMTNMSIVYARKRYLRSKDFRTWARALAKELKKARVSGEATADLILEEAIKVLEREARIDEK